MHRYRSQCNRNGTENGVVGGSSPSRSVNSGDVEWSGVEYPTFPSALLSYPPRRNNQPISIRARGNGNLTGDNKGDIPNQLPAIPRERCSRRPRGGVGRHRRQRRPALTQCLRLCSRRRPTVRADEVMSCRSVWVLGPSPSGASYTVLAVPPRSGAKEAVKNALSRWGRKVGEATRKAEDLSRNTWQHCGWFFVG